MTSQPHEGAIRPARETIYKRDRLHLKYHPKNNINNFDQEENKDLEEEKKRRIRGGEKRSFEGLFLGHTTYMCEIFRDTFSYKKIKLQSHQEDTFWCQEELF